MRTSLFLIALAACSNEGSATSQAKPEEEPERKLAGVYPDRFKCDSVATPEQITQALGASYLKQVDSPSSVPRGLPRPCTYEVMASSQPEYWTFDFDCRDGMKQRADALFAQYTRTSAELIEQYNAVADAGPQPGSVKRDAGVKDKDAGPDAPQRAPEPASEVQVGLKALDHHGQGLIFIDDDAPCYVRVVGPDNARRLDLAKLIAKGLTFANAPMTPRPFK
jgi:hypothetical protein